MTMIGKCRHGIFQQLTAWADGPNLMTQCPIVPGKRYTYKFNVIGQEGTLWWHAHVSVLRATVYGALIIRPRSGTHGYPFPKPHKEVPILLGMCILSQLIIHQNTSYWSYSITINWGNFWKFRWMVECQRGRCGERGLAVWWCTQHLWCIHHQWKARRSLQLQYSQT